MYSNKLFVSRRGVKQKVCFEVSCHRIDAHPFQTSISIDRYIDYRFFGFFKNVSNIGMYILYGHMDIFLGSKTESEVGFAIGPNPSAKIRNKTQKLSIFEN